MDQIKDPVNLSLGDKLSEYAGRRTRTTHKNTIWVEIDEPDEHFRSEISFDILKHLPGTRMILAPDGIGTKVLLIDAAHNYRNAAQDLSAMTAGDITRSGGCPVVFSNVLDVSTLGENEESETFIACKSLIDGLVDVANKLKFACVKGETAELNVCVSSSNPNATLKFNWGGFMIGIDHPTKRITGNTLAAGQIIVACREFGFRSNGISKLRGIGEKHFGTDWWQNEDFMQKIATPSTLYDHFFTWLNGWENKENSFEYYIKPHLICHLSGGSFKGKFFEDILKRKDLSAYLDDLWEPSPIMKQCAEWGGMSDEELYEKWSCGQGALVILNSLEVEKFIEYAKEFSIDAKVAGEITKTIDPELIIRSKFSDQFFKYR